DGRNALGVHLHRDAAAVVDDLDSPDDKQGDTDRNHVPSHRLADEVVNDNPDQMVQNTPTGGAEAHAGALANRLETLEDGDGGGTVGLARLRAGFVGVLGSHWSVALLTC